MPGWLWTLLVLVPLLVLFCSLRWFRKPTLESHPDAGQDPHGRTPIDSNRLGYGRSSIVGIKGAATGVGAGGCDGGGC